MPRPKQQQILCFAQIFNRDCSFPLLYPPNKQGGTDGGFLLPINNGAFAWERALQKTLPVYPQKQPLRRSSIHPLSSPILTSL